MTPKLLILFLFAWTTAFTQTPASKESTTAKNIGADTLKAVKSDTISITKEQLVDKELRVIFEDTSKPDYFKYIFPILTLLRGLLSDPIRITSLHQWHVEAGAVFEDVGQWKRPNTPEDRP